jgi:hypothetical protein
MKQAGFPGHHHRPGALSDRCKSGIERYELGHESPKRAQAIDF